MSPLAICAKQETILPGPRSPLLNPCDIHQLQLKKLLSEYTQESGRIHYLFCPSVVLSGNTVAMPAAICWIFPQKSAAQLVRSLTVWFRLRDPRLDCE